MGRILSPGFLPFAVERGFAGCWKAGPQAFSIIVEFVDFPCENAYTDSIEKEAILSVMCIGRATRGGIDTKENERKAACYGFSGFWRFWGPRGLRSAT